jgi:tRNA-splicing ligase RtcB (3'-phosphate/5'-hydroxy nucleic acid ligase)
MIKIYGNHDQITLDQFVNVMKHDDAIHGVLCADGHLGYSHPIGGVVAYGEHISLSGVGFDIACGNKAIKLDTKFVDIKDRLPQIMRDIAKHISFGVGRANNEPIDTALFEDSRWSELVDEELFARARKQLGTVGSGNHYVDIFSDDEGFVWVGVHFGSRGFGHAVATKYMKATGAKDSMNADAALIHKDHELALEYRALHDLAGLYAYEGRDWVCERVRKIIGGAVLDSIHNHHNFMWEEEHFGEKYFVVRKGATPAFAGQRGFVGGSMGDNSVILHGVENEEAKLSLFSTIHGAGRVMSRTAALGKVTKDPETGKKSKARGCISYGQWHEWMTKKGVHFHGGDVDEAPQAYRRLDEVLEIHKETIKLDHILTPKIVLMAGSGEFDPYKD